MSSSSTTEVLAVLVLRDCAAFWKNFRRDISGLLVNKPPMVKATAHAHYSIMVYFELCVIMCAILRKQTRPAASCQQFFLSLCSRLVEISSDDI